jgi:glycosyltransferase involved in cell wall biosynthesis
MPKVSIVMPAYNEEKRIGRAIDSILSQSFEDFELIIINDGSSDNTENIIKEYQKKDERIILISQENSGVAKALNVGINIAKGEYIARMDADDISDKERLKIQVKFLDENPRIAMVGSWGYIVDEYKCRKLEVKLPCKYEAIKRFLIRDNAFIHTSVMLRRSVLEEVGYYRDIRAFEDYDLWIRIAKFYPIENLPLFLVSRYENNNIYNKMTYKDLDKYKIYRTRLRYQLEALYAFGLYPESLYYIARTLVCIFLTKMGLRK